VTVGRRWAVGDWLCRSWGELLTLAVIVAVAVFFGFYRIAEVPPGLHFDEAGYTLDAERILQGELHIFFTGRGGEEPLWHYLVTPAVGLFPGQITPLRVTASLVSLVTVLLLYFVVRQVFADEEHFRWLAALTALGFAISYVHVHLGRLILRLNSLPPVELLCFLCLWWGLHTGKRGPFIMAGAFLGGTLYTYLASRFIPVLLLIFFLVEAGISFLDGRRPSLLRRHFANLLLAALVALLVFAPLAVYFIFNPEQFAWRANVVSILNPEVNRGNLWGALADSALRNLGSFGFFGDGDPEFNLPGRPILDPISAALFIAGLAISLARIRRPPYLFTVLWWLIMFLPSILSYERVPRFMRAQGAIPAVLVFPAIALVALGVAARRLWAGRLRAGEPGVPSHLVRAVALAALVLFFGVTSAVTFHDYFIAWAGSPEAYENMHTQYVDLARQMQEETTADVVYILPADLRVTYPYRHHALKYLYNGPASYAFIVDDEENVVQKLTQATQGRNIVRLVKWKVGEHATADPKGLFPFLLERFGERVSEVSYRGYDLVTYRLYRPDTDFALGQPLREMHATFGQELALVGFSYGEASASLSGDECTVSSGGRIWVTLRWRAAGPLAEDEKASLILVDAAGHRAGQVDRLLLDRTHVGTSLWAPGTEAFGYYILPVDRATAPGPYKIHVLVYSPSTLAHLPVAEGMGGTEVAVGTIRVRPPEAVVAPEEVAVQHPLVQTAAPGLRLLGYDGGPAEQVQPGDRVSLALYWQALSGQLPDYECALYLRGGGQELETGPAELLAGDDFSSSRWRGGELLRGWRDLRVPLRTPPGEYTLTVAVLEAASGRQAGQVDITNLRVEGRPHLTEPPPIAHPLGANLGDRVALLGYEIKAPGEMAQVQAGGVVTVTLYWRALAEMETSYTVFVHLLDGAGRVRAQRDTVPGGGSLPTTGWLPGEVIVDEYAVPLGQDMEPGDYTIEVGMYDASTGARLPVLDTAGAVVGDRVLLPGEVVVR
jgi:uncharacterized membrane protein YhaH (DUF805 family)